MFAIDPTDPTPLYAQLGRAIRSAVATGRLRAGDQLPTVRQLAVDLKVNANTVAKVYAELERTGVVATRRGVGTFIEATPGSLMGPAERTRRLTASAHRYLAEAAALGFDAEGAIELIRGLLTPEENDDDGRHRRFGQAQ